MINGIINVYKELGYTSFDVIAKLRGILKQKKIGHTGTLDPNACGVLPVCLGNATKLCDMLTDKDKTYETVMLLGVATDTQDITGEILEKKEVNVSAAEVISVIDGFVGEYNQIPPMYSALKVNGRKLCDLAREGIEVERKPRPVTINSIVIKDINLPRVTMEVSCSKGTYIRTLCHDIGIKLGTGGCVEELKRTRVSAFDISESLTLDKIEELFKSDMLSQYVVGVEKVFEDYGVIRVKESADKLLSNGNKFTEDDICEKVISDKNKGFKVYKSDNTFIGVYEYDSIRESYKPVKMFFE